MTLDQNDKPLKFFCVYSGNDAYHTHMIDRSQNAESFPSKVDYKHEYFTKSPRNYSRDAEGWYEYVGHSFDRPRKNRLKVEHEYFK